MAETVKQIDDGGMAFPGINGPPSEYAEGLSVRDYFAGKALSGDFAAQNELTGEFTNQVSDDTLLDRAMLFYRMADAMIAARKTGAA